MPYERAKIFQTEKKSGIRGEEHRVETSSAYAHLEGHESINNRLMLLIGDHDACKELSVDHGVFGTD